MTQARHADPYPLGGEGLPYSKGIMARALVAVGVPATAAYELASLVELDLAGNAEAAVDFERLHVLARNVLGESAGDAAIDRLQRYQELRELDVPLIILVGGGTGTGKSSVATEAAYRLGITRVTSTDVIRQTMRAFFSEEFMPSIHYSSFEAVRGLPRAEREAAGDPVVAGFLDQTRNVLVGVKAAMARALEEGFSIVLEGVHLVPGLLAMPSSGALVVQCVLAIEDEEMHESHFWIRDAVSDGVRPLEKYLEGLDGIRRIQDSIVARAERAGVPVIQNGNIERAIGEVIELVLTEAERMRDG